ncbi:mRNA turnover protein 4 [Pelomyxa schiedti]|nr:mRNA turnover protein 4 [Pelomyxa schiedti]
MPRVNPGKALAVALGKTKKRSRLHKQEIISKVQAALDEYPNVVVFSVQNIKNMHMQKVRLHWAATSRFFIGCNNVVKFAIGETPEKEYKPGLRKITPFLTESCGIMLTKSPLPEVIDYFRNLAEPNPPHAGFKATQTVELDQGPLPQFDHSMEPFLRKQGAPTALKDGVITLIQDYTVCNEGDVLTAQQARLLCLLGITMAEFRIVPRCSWNLKSFQEH